jgi:hypothetical protein
MKNWQLSRRALLQQLGLGAACLPLLQEERSWAAGTGARHLMVLQMSEGYRQTSWKPATGVLGALPPSLMPLEPHKGDLIIAPDMSNPGVGGSGHSSYGCIAYGKGATGGGYKEPTGPTFDQVAANGLPKPASGRKSLHFWVQMHLPPLPTTQAGGTHCFWTGPGQPINPQGDPALAYKDLFAGGEFNKGADPAEVARLIARRKSLLDYVGDSLQEFGKNLGKNDRAAIQAHLTTVRDLETQLQAEASNTNGSCASGAPPTLNIDDRTNYPKIQQAHFANMLSALKCGVSSVVTLQHGDSSGNSINFGSFVPGLPALSKNNYKSPWRNWHDLGHNPVMDGVDHKKIVDTWFMARFSELFTKMKAIPEEGGTMFDHSIVVITNHMQEGANHDAQKNPMMVVAGKATGLQTGQCVGSAGKGVGMLYADVLTALGVPHTYGAGLGLVKGA